MARHVFVVSRNHRSLYDDLRERFRDDGNVEVILDRRTGEQRRSPDDAVGRPCSAERRRRRTPDDDLTTRSHVIITIDPEIVDP